MEEGRGGKEKKKGRQDRVGEKKREEQKRK